MRMQLLMTLTCVLSAAACGGSTANQQAASDPSNTASGSASVTSAPIVTAGSTDNQANAALNTNPAPMGGVATNAPAGANSNMSGSALTPIPSGGASMGATPVTPAATSGDHPALTPMNQGNSSDETKITASIRKAVMGDKSLSFGAKNVKIITVGTKVTLRGTVKNDQERTTIENDARSAAGVTDVDNQLTVK